MGTADPGSVGNWWRHREGIPGKPAAVRESYSFSYSPPDVRLSTVNPADLASLTEG